MKIRWFGHASFLVEASGKNIYIDPYVLPENTPIADIILITHDHYDHCDEGKVKQIYTDSTQIITTAKTAEKLSGRNVRIVSPGDVVELGSIKVHAVHAYNINKPFHPKGMGIGFIVEAEDKRVYHAGDTDFIPEMRNLRDITVVMLPVAGTYTMNMNEAVDAVLAIRPKIAIPMHYNFLEGLHANADEFKRMVESKSDVRVEILEGGRTIEL